MKGARTLTVHELALLNKAFECLARQTVEDATKDGWRASELAMQLMECGKLENKVRAVFGLEERS